MVVLPGAEMTRNTINRDTSVHVLALGLDEFLSADGDPLDMLREIRARGAVSVACHPHEMSEWFANTWYLWNRRKIVAPLVDLWEVGCRWELFPVISRESLPHLANSDFHRPEHLYAWKTLLKAEKSREGVLAALKRGTGIGVLRLTPKRRPRPHERARLGRSARSRVVRGGLRGFRRGAARGPAPRPEASRSTGGRARASRSSSRSAGSTRISRRTSTRSFGWTTAPTRSSSRSRRRTIPPIRSRAASRTAHPSVPSVFVFDGREPGGNAKVNRLTAALRHAQHRLILFSDGNVRVRPDFLRRAVSWFADPRYGLVSHLFLATGARGFASRIESLYLNGCLQGGTALLSRILAAAVRRREVDPGLAPRPGRHRGDRRPARISGGGLPAGPPGPGGRLPRGALGRRPRHDRGAQEGPRPSGRGTGAGR